MTWRITRPASRARRASNPAQEDAWRTWAPARGRGRRCPLQRGENHLFFDIGGRTLISRVIDGQFLAHERVIPKANDKHIEFERDRLTNAVKRVALLSNERSRAGSSSTKAKWMSRRVVLISAKLTRRYRSTIPVAPCRSVSCSIRPRLSLGCRHRCRVARSEGRGQAVVKPVGAEGCTTTPT